MPVLIDDNIDFDFYMRETEAQERVKPVTEYLNSVMHQISPAFDAPKNPKLPFYGAHVEFAPGEVSLWAGENGSGKSMLQGQVVATFAESGDPCCIASFEMKPVKTLARVCRQVLNHRNPNRDQVSQFFNRNAETLWLYDQQGSVDQRRLLAVIRHCAEKLGCKHIAIDSLMKCVQDEDDYNGQKRFVDALTIAARDFNTHIHLVHHLRKREQGNENKRPSKSDIKGTGAITDLVDNVLIVWRNRKKEQDIENGKVVPEGEPDAVLICEKQRNGEWEGSTRLYFNKDTFRYSDGRRGLASHL